MRIERLEVENFLRHRRATVVFGPRITLVAGPNAAGKTSLARALYAGFFVPHGLGVWETFRAAGAEGTTVVRIRFDARGETYDLEKVFGRRGGTVLRGAGLRWTDAEAERRLRELWQGRRLAGKRPRQVPWGSAAPHLWVLHGTAGDPASWWDAACLEMLETHGDGPLGPVDGAVFHELRSLAATYLTGATGALSERKDSPLARRREELREAAARLSERREAAVRTEAARARAERLRNEHRRIEAERAARTGARDELAEKVRRLRAIQGRLDRVEARVRALRDVAKAADDLDRLLEELGRERAAEDAARASLQEIEREIATRRAEVERARGRVKELAGALARARAKKDLAEAARRWEDLERARTRRRVCEAALAEARARLAQTPSVSAEAEAKVAEAAREVDRSRERLDAAGARIEIRAVPPGVEVEVDGVPVRAGDAVAVTEAVDVRVGGAVLRVVPGADAGEARRRYESARMELARALEAAGAKTVKEVCTLRQTYEERRAHVDRAEAELRGCMDPRRLAEERERCRRSMDAARELLGDPQEDERAPLEGDPAEQVEAARRLLSEAERDRDLAEAAAAEAEARWRAARQVVEEGRRRGAALAGRVAEVFEALTGTPIDSVEAAEGGDGVEAIRSAAAPHAATVRRELSEALTERAAHAARLGDRSLRDLEAELRRESDAVESLRKQGAQVAADLAAARAEAAALAGDGTVWDDLGEAEAACARARSAYRAELRRVHALLYLLKTFEDVRKEGTRALHGPLRAAVCGYLGGILGGCGGGGRFDVQVDRTDHGGAPLEAHLRQPGDPRPFPAEETSAGTREQLGIAVRLAQVELVVAETGETWPVILDDPFVHTDPHRMQGALGMLARAAGRGVQVIVLSCRPETYLGLGPSMLHRVDLPAPG